MDGADRLICAQHSGCTTDINNLKEETVRQATVIERLDAKLNMILGGIILSPFLWALLTGFVKLGG